MIVNIEGVSSSRVYLPPNRVFRSLFEFFINTFPHIESKEWAARFNEGLVMTLSGMPVKADDLYRGNTHLLYFRRLVREPEIPFAEDILYQDDHIVVADKPHFLPVTPSGLYLHQTLLNRLKKRTGIQTLSPIHRIDRDTAGLVIFSVKPQERAHYQNLFRDRAVKKVYEAIAPYYDEETLSLPMTYESRIVESEHFLQMKEVQGKPNTDTYIELIETNKPWAKYRLKPGSGKKHQLRAHMNALSIPIKNDHIYPILTPYQEYNIDYSIPLQLLAKTISFVDPISKRERYFVSPRELNLQHSINI